MESQKNDGEQKATRYGLASFTNFFEGLWWKLNLLVERRVPLFLQIGKFNGTLCSYWTLELNWRNAPPTDDGIWLQFRACSLKVASIWCHQMHLPLAGDQTFWQRVKFEKYSIGDLVEALFAFSMILKLPTFSERESPAGSIGFLAIFQWKAIAFKLKVLTLIFVMAKRRFGGEIFQQSERTVTGRLISACEFSQNPED